MDLPGATVDVTLFSGSYPDFAAPPSENFITSTNSPVDDAGQWTAALIIPANAAPGQYTVTGRCQQSEGGTARYANVVITVLAATTTTTTVATTTSIAPTTSTTAPQPAARPASAVTVTPTYTG